MHDDTQSDDITDVKRVDTEDTVRDATTDRPDPPDVPGVIRRSRRNPIPPAQSAESDLDIVPPGFTGFKPGELGAKVQRARQQDQQEMAQADAPEHAEHTESNIDAGVLTTSLDPTEVIAMPEARTDARASEELAHRLAEWREYGPNYLQEITKGYRGLLTTMEHEAPERIESISRIGNRREVYDAARKTGDRATAQRILEDDRAFKRAAITALELSELEVRRNPIPATILEEWNELRTEQLEQLRSDVAKAITRREQKLKKREELTSEEITETYHIRASYERALRSGQEALARILQRDDLWFKEQTFQTLTRIIEERRRISAAETRVTRQ